MAGLVALYAVGLLALGSAMDSADRRVDVADVEVPSTVGLTEKRAEAVLDEDGLIMVVKVMANDVIAAGKVFEQTPIAGAKVEVGSSVTAVVSTGPAGKIVPETTGQQSGAAEKVLNSVGLTARIVPTHDEVVRPGEVLRSKPAAGRRAPADGVVTIAVSDGPAPRTVPVVDGRTATDVLAELGRAGLIPAKVTDAVDHSVPVGTVISISPPSGTPVPRGTKVDLKVSAAPVPLTMPAVEGLTRATAGKALDESGLDATFRNVALPMGDARDGRVVRQGVMAGSKVPPGTRVEVLVGVAPPPPTTTTTPSPTSTSTTTTAAP